MTGRPFDLSRPDRARHRCRRGIGRAAAVALAAAGADIVGVSATLERTAATSRADVARSVAASAVPLRLRRPRAVHALVEALAADPAVDILVNNAGTIARTPAAEHSDELWDRVLEVNLTAQFVLTRELGRSMLARGRGKIVFVASLLSFQGGINVPGYAAARAGSPSSPRRSRTSGRRAAST